MSKSCFDATQVRTWLNSGLTDSMAVIALSDPRETADGVVADYDTPTKIGRVVCWFTGLVDFEILSVEDGSQLYFRHEDEGRIEAPVLREALSEFLAFLTKT